MINAKIKIIAGYPSEAENQANNFLKTIDVRQIVKIEQSSGSEYKLIVMITYLEFEDIRESRIECILDKEN